MGEFRALGIRFVCCGLACITLAVPVLAFGEPEEEDFFQLLTAESEDSASEVTAAPVTPQAINTIFAQQDTLEAGLDVSAAYRAAKNRPCTTAPNTAAPSKHLATPGIASAGGVLDPQINQTTSYRAGNIAATTPTPATVTPATSMMPVRQGTLDPQIDLAVNYRVARGQAPAKAESVEPAPVSIIPATCVAPTTTSAAAPPVANAEPVVAKCDVELSNQVEACAEGVDLAEVYCEPVSELAPAVFASDIDTSEPEHAQQAHAASAIVASLPAVATEDPKQAAAILPVALTSDPKMTTLRRPIGEITIDPAAPTRLTTAMQKIPDDLKIRNIAADEFGAWEEPRYDIVDQSARFTSSCYAWAAPAFFHRPLYFEQPNVERYGHYVACSCGSNCLQSAASAAHFFGTIPVLPYKMGADPCWERHYTLGTYRPGSCNPHRLVWPEFSALGLASQAAATTGLVFLVP